MKQSRFWKKRINLSKKKKITHIKRKTPLFRFKFIEIKNKNKKFRATKFQRKPIWRMRLNNKIFFYKRIKYYKKYKRSFSFWSAFLKQNDKIQRLNSTFKNRLLLQKHFRLTIYPSFKKKDWKNLIQKKTLGKHNLAEFIWLLDSRLDFFLYRLRIVRRLIDIQKIINNKLVFVDNSLITNPSFYLSIPTLIQFNFYKFAFSKLFVYIRKLTYAINRGEKSHIRIKWYFQKRWKFFQYWEPNAVYKYAHFLEATIFKPTFFLIKNPYLHKTILHNNLYQDLYKKVYENRIIF